MAEKKPPQYQDLGQRFAALLNAIKDPVEDYPGTDLSNQIKKAQAEAQLAVNAEKRERLLKVLGSLQQSAEGREKHLKKTIQDLAQVKNRTIAELKVLQECNQALLEGNPFPLCQNVSQRGEKLSLMELLDVSSEQAAQFSKLKVDN